MDQAGRREATQELRPATGAIRSVGRAMAAEVMVEERNAGKQEGGTAGQSWEALESDQRAGACRSVLLHFQEVTSVCRSAMHEGHESEFHPRCHLALAMALVQAWRLVLEEAAHIAHHDVLACPPLQSLTMWHSAARLARSQGMWPGQRQEATVAQGRLMTNSGEAGST